MGKENGPLLRLELKRKRQRKVVFAFFLYGSDYLLQAYPFILILSIVDVIPASLPRRFGFCLIQTKDLHAMLIKRFALIQIDDIKFDFSFELKLRHHFEVEPCNLFKTQF